MPRMSGTPIDFAPLGRQPTPAELQQIRADVTRGDFGKESQEEATGPTGGTVVGWMVGGFLVFIGAATTVLQAIGGDPDLGIGFAFMAVGAAIGFGVRLLVNAADRRDWRRTVQLVAFARANDLDFQPVSKVPDLPGVPRRSGHASTRNRMSWTAHGLPAEMATYHRAGGGSEAHSVTCRYLAVRMDVDLPAMTFRCGRRGPARGEDRFGPDAFEGRAHSLRLGKLRLDERATTLFSDPVVELLTDREHPCNAEYVTAWFLAYYRRGTTCGTPLAARGRPRHGWPP